MTTVDALIAERDRLRAEVERAVTALEEWEQLVGIPLPQAIAAAHARIEADDPYALIEFVEQQQITIIKLRDAFDRAAASRNRWRDFANRLDAEVGP
jgi:hypothetical protein